MAEAGRVTRSVFLLGGMLAAAGAAVAQGTVPDAQVESNVLKALAGAPDLASEAITTRTVYGVVTLSGSVHDEAARRHAETLASNAAGVKKVVDELQLGTSAATATTAAGTTANSSAPMVLQSDGTYAPASASDGPAPGSAPAEQAQRNNPEADQALDQQIESQQPNSAQMGQQTQTGQQTQQGAPGYDPQGQYGQPQQQGAYPQQQGAYPQQQGGYPQQQGTYPQGSAADTNRRPLNSYPQPGYPQQNGYPQQGGYPQQNGYPQQGGYPQQQGYSQQPVYGGQMGGQAVVIPSGTLVRVRINRALSSNHSQIGSSFDGVVVNDVVADGVVAIPRGAAVLGTIVDAKSSGVLKGRGELSVQLTQVTLAGRSFPIVSDLWAHNGGDKSIETLDKAAGFGAVGALFGAVAGGGVGAAVGGGIGAAAGVGSSAASGRGQVFIPSEGMMAFHLAQPATVTTVSEQEMQRLAFGVPSGADARYARRPGYYPGPYAPYGYPR